MPTIAQTTLKALLDEIEATDPEMMPPPATRESGDKHLGYLTDEYVKKVFSLNSFYRREAKRMQVDMEASGEDPNRNATFHEQKQRHETLLELFWYLLRTNLNCWETDIGIRKGWEIVRCNQNDDKSPAALIKKLLES